jgi:AraC-like DNA-binding protein
VWEEHPGTSPAVRRRWRAFVEVPGRYPIAASEYWGISFIRRGDGSLAAELDGPTLAAQVVESVEGESYWGVELAAHVFVPGVDKHLITGATIALPVQDGCVRIGEHLAAVPAWGELEDFVDTLLGQGALVADEHIHRALSGKAEGWSPRSWQRRFRHVTGLTRKQIEQLERARSAYRLLAMGMPCSEAAQLAGYADQAHLTRAMRLFEGQTPARILAGELPPT